MAEYLFNDWARLERGFSRARTLYLFSDFDGTLAAITRTPSLTKLDREGRNLLVKLASNKRFKVALISGRSAVQLKRMVRVDGIFYAGNHGLEISGPGLKFDHPSATRRMNVLKDITNDLHSILSAIRGVVIEDKELTISIHYRMVKPSQRELVVKKVGRVVAKYQNAKLTTGKMVLEVRPRVRWHKGFAAKTLFHSLGGHGSLVYIGDDTTDEDAFKSLKGNITIRVMRRPTKTGAKYYLRSVKEVWQFIRLLSDILSSSEYLPSSTCKEPCRP